MVSMPSRLFDSRRYGRRLSLGEKLENQISRPLREAPQGAQAEGAPKE